MTEWWQLSGTDSTETGAGQAAIRGESNQIGTVELAALSVTSEKASANLVARSFATVTADPALTSTSIGSTAYVLFKPVVPIQLENIYAVPLTAWAAVTSGAESINVWSAAGGVVGTWTASSTAVGAVGVPLTLTLASTGISLAAASSLFLNIIATTCSNIPAHAFQIDYTTTG